MGAMSIKIENFSECVEHWSNSENRKIYDQYDFNIVDSLLKRSGLGNNIDLELLQPYVIQSESILEVGAGLGRVLQFFIRNKFHGNLSAIEQSSSFCKSLANRFDKRVNIFQENLLEFHIQCKYSCILWLWCGVYDFNKDEQRDVLEKLVSSLEDDGILILDFVFVGTEIPQDQSFQINGARFKRHLISKEEIMSYAKLFGLDGLAFKNYRVNSDEGIRKRTFAFLTYKKEHPIFEKLSKDTSFESKIAT